MKIDVHTDILDDYSNIDIKLLPGERIVHVEHFPPLIINHPPAVLAELTRLAHSKLVHHIGDNGPVLAAISLDHTVPRKSQSTELRRYEALFGRDSLRVAMDLMSFFPHLARTTIIELAKLQGTTFDMASEEEPGRIIHEQRNPNDEIRQEITKEFGWGWPYYGSVDATPEYIRTVVAYSKSVSDGPKLLNEKFIDKAGHTRSIADSVRLAVEWITRRMDRNPEGVIESLKSCPGGIENQFWKDSWDAYFHADGTIANHKSGVSSIEVLRVVYDALIDAAELYHDRLGLHDEAEDLLKRADKLKRRIMDTFWVNEKGGYFALGSDRDDTGALRIFKIRTSNMGHLLGSRLLDGDDPSSTAMRESIVRQLFSPELLSPCGIRTLATDEIRFRPGSYHNGSVWPWDNYFIIKGLERHRYDRLADNLAERLLDTVSATGRFPEFVRGDNSTEVNMNSQIIDVWDERNQRLNRVEQPPQEVQAWSVAAILAIKYGRKQRQQRALDRPISEFEASVLANIT